MWTEGKRHHLDLCRAKLYVHCSHSCDAECRITKGLHYVRLCHQCHNLQTEADKFSDNKKVLAPWNIAASILQKYFNVLYLHNKIFFFCMQFWMETKPSEDDIIKKGHAHLWFAPTMINLRASRYHVGCSLIGHKFYLFFVVVVVHFKPQVWSWIFAKLIILFEWFQKGSQLFIFKGFFHLYMTINTAWANNPYISC